MIENQNGDWSLLNEALTGQRSKDRPRKPQLSRYVPVKKLTKEQEDQQRWLSVFNDALFETIGGW